MKMRSVVLGALGAALCPAVGFAVTAGVAPAKAAASAPQNVHTLVLTMRYADSHFHFAGEDPNHPQIGDRFIDRVALRRLGQVVGEATSICTLVAGTSETDTVTRCDSTYELPLGEIVAAGTDDSSNTTTDAITGGTGVYAFIAGTATTASHEQAATLSLRYRLGR